MTNNKRRTRHLVCPECGEAARRYPPRRWVTATGPRPRWSHHDGEPLCPVPGPTGSRPADPRPAPPARRVRRHVPATPTAAVAGAPDPGPGRVLAPSDAVPVGDGPASVAVLSDLQTEALREVADPIAVAGDSEWEVAVYVYALSADLSYPGCTVPAGSYVRTVRGNWVCAYPVPDASAAVAYAEQIEQRYTAWAEPGA